MVTTLVRALSIPHSLLNFPRSIDLRLITIQKSSALTFNIQPAKKVFLALSLLNLSQPVVGFRQPTSTYIMASETQPDQSSSSSITLRIPSKYASSSTTTAANAFTNPPLDWLARTWTVTHSTLAMWRTAQNVRITYAPLAPASPSSAAAARIDDLVEYEKASGKGGVKTVSGVDTACAPGDTGSWDWRGKGLLGFVTSHWEVLGWGERASGGAGDGDCTTERWVVTWFAPTLFTKEGVDLYSDRKEGMSPELAHEILTGLKGLDAKPVVEMVGNDMEAVKIQVPWKER